MRKTVKEHTFEEFDSFIQRWENFVITSHHEPDADATGSEYALLYALQEKGKKAKIINPDPPDPRFTYYKERDVFHTLGNSFSKDIKDFALIMVDNSDFDHMGAGKTELVPYAKDIFIIDHHNTRKDILNSYIDPTSAATTEILFRLFEHWKLEIPPDVAWGLFTGLVFDTGSFVYPKTTGASFQMAETLLSLGVKPKEVHSQLYEKMTPQKLRLLAEVQAGFEILYKDQIAFQTLTKEILKKTGAESSDSDNMINYPLKCSSVVISVFFREIPDGTVKVSLRSKGNLDMATFAQSFGGGGHTNAAGFTVQEGLEQIKQRVLNDLTQLLDEE